MIIFINLSYLIIYLGLRIVESLPFKIGLCSDSLVSLVSSNTDINFNKTCEISVKFREFSPDSLKNGQ